VVLEGFLSVSFFDFLVCCSAGDSKESIKVCSNRESDKGDEQQESEEAGVVAG